MTKAMTNWLEQRETAFKWAARISQILLIPLLAIGLRWGRLELEKYGRENFASSSDIVQVRNDISSVKSAIIRLEQRQTEMVTHKENDANIKDAARKEAVILQQINTLSVKFDVMSENLKEMKTDIREMRKNQATMMEKGPLLPFENRKAFAGQ